METAEREIPPNGRAYRMVVRGDLPEKGDRFDWSSLSPGPLALAGG